jgi:glycosyltransferase involved in cell wall biosynthesis
MLIRAPASADLDTGRWQKILLSVVVPCFNEEEVIAETHRRLVEVLGHDPTFQLEIVYVDDGSRDRTLALLRGLQAADSRVRVVSFARNFGHQFAVTAGLDHCAGEAVCIIDADLQDPPEVILEMLECWRNGADVAYGVRTEREGESAFKQWTAKMFYRTINSMSDTPIPLDTGDFRLMDRAAVEAFQAMPERDRFVRGMVAWTGFRQQAVPYRRAARFAGTTKYPLRKMLRFAADGIMSFSIAPLRMAIYVGLSASALAMAGVAYALALRLATQNWVTGWTLLFIAVLFIGGIQLMFLGVLGEYVGRIYGEVKRRPLYLVREQLGFEPGRVPQCASTVPIRVPEALMHPPRQRVQSPARTGAEAA